MSTSATYKFERAYAPATNTQILLRINGARKNVDPTMSTVRADGSQPVEIALWLCWWGVGGLSVTHTSIKFCLSVYHLTSANVCAMPTK